jgi:hypothetical protein
MSMEIKIIYLLGLGHSGTTLMGRLLNAHSKTVSTGGTKNIPLFVSGRKSCTCGAGTPDGCDYWSRVDTALAKRGLSLSSLDFGYDNQQNLDKQELRLYFESVLEAAGAEVIVDTSRRRTYFTKLEQVPGVTLIPVHIFKDPRAQYSSNKRKGMGMVRSVWNYNTRGRRVRTMKPKGPPVVHVSYEALCRDPRGQLQRIMAAAGLEFEEQQVTAFGEAETHILGGNRMRSDSSSVIRLDESWRKRLTPFEQKTVSLLGASGYRRNLELSE